MAMGDDPARADALRAEPQPGPGSDTFIKRIVAGGGDAISIARGFVIRNGIKEQVDYVKAGDERLDFDFLTTVVIPSGTWYLLGDNRAQSMDSRYWGPIPTDWIIGKVLLPTDPHTRD
jgi:signal peptidase I